MKRSAVVLWLVLVSSPASADRRLFTYTYEYQTVLEGSLTIDLWHTQSRSTWDSDDPGSFTALEHVLEIETGLTDSWDAGLSAVFTQLASHDPAIESQAYSFEELRLETRYRIADRGELPVDVLLYGQAATQFADDIYQLQGRVVLARDFELFTAAVNAIGAVTFGPDVADTTLVGWAAGVTYEMHPKLNLGVESFGIADVEADDLDALVGPVIAVAPSSNLWLTLTAGFGLADAPDFEARLILGIEL